MDFFLLGFVKNGSQEKPGVVYYAKLARDYMKRFATIAFLLGAIGFMPTAQAQVANTQTVNTDKPSVATGVAPYSKEMSDKIKEHLKGMKPLQGTVEKISYYDESGEAQTFPFPLPRKNNINEHDYTVYGYSQRFTSSFTLPYLDSAVILIVPRQYDGNLTVQALTQVSAGGAGYPFPDKAVGNAISVPAPDDITIDEPYELKVQLGHKRNGGTGANRKSFFIQLSNFDTVQNRVDVVATAFPESGRQLDPETDRMYIHSEDAKENWDPPAGADSAYNSFWAGLTLPDDPETVFYPNAVMIAWVSDNLGRSEAVLPDGFELAQNYPNPFNPSTQISYVVPLTSQVSLKVYNALGVEVASLVDGKKAAGTYNVTFDASNLPSGTYTYTLKAGSFSTTKRMVLNK